MKHLTSAELKEIALDIEVELGQLARLRAEIERVNQLLDTLPELADILYENQGFKLYGFYNGCERIFKIVASELNGALERYLAFRHVIRNIYGYELEVERIAQLVAQQATVWENFEHEVRAFVAWLRDTADQLE
jgi:hypothetical protein